MKRMRVLAALSLAIVAPPVLAQTTSSGAVQRDDASARVQRERHQLGIYGVQAIDHLARDGVEARRLFVLNASGGDVALITFSRDHGGTPRLSIHPPGYGLSRPAPLHVAIPMPAWEEVRAESAAFHRGQRMAVAANNICHQPLTYIVETSTPAEGTALPRSAVRIVDQCSGPGHPGWLVERALGAVPACGSLIAPAATPYDALILCATLRAEPDAVAARVALAPLFQPGSRDAASVRAAFAPDAVLDWDQAQANGTAADRWLRQAQSRGAALSFDRIEALDGGRARLTGFVIFRVQEGGGEPREYRARAMLELARDGSGRLRIVRGRIGRYRRA